MSVKPFLDYFGQLARLESRGLSISNHDSATAFLKHHNYYRLSAYRFPFQSSHDQFLEGTEFEDLVALYRFDRGLRLLVGEACKALEISVRARWAYVLGEKHGELAYEDPHLFRNAQQHSQHLVSLDRELSRSHEVFISHYRNNHNMPRPPIWAACEVMSFGLLTRFYTNIKQASLRKQIAKTYGLSADNLKSLLLHASYLRNLSAHHSRIWNRSFTITLSLPNRQPAGIIPALNKEPAAERKIYNSLVLLAHIMNTVSGSHHSNHSHHWQSRLKSHLLTLNRSDHSEMGFPANWQNHAFWQL